MSASAGGWAKAGAALSLASELAPVSIGDVKDVGKAAKKLLAKTDDVANVERVQKKPLLIGESVERLETIAREEGATILYKPRKSTLDDPAKLMQGNKRAVQRAKKEGREILDAGIDPDRARRSPYYQMEKEELRNYPVKKLKTEDN